MIFLASGIFLQILSIREHDSRLLICYLRIKSAAVNRDLRLLALVDLPISGSIDDKSLHDKGVKRVPALDLADTDARGVEFEGVLRSALNAGLGDKLSEVGSVVVELGGDAGVEAAGDFGLVADVLEFEGLNILKQFNNLNTRSLIPEQNLTGMQSHLNQDLGLGEQFSSKRKHQARSITALLFLHLGGHHDHLCGGVLDLDLRGLHQTGFKIPMVGRVLFIPLS